MTGSGEELQPSAHGKAMENPRQDTLLPAIACNRLGFLIPRCPMPFP